MKKGMLLSVILIVFLISVVSAGSCDNNDTIMKLYQSTNSHGALWNDTNYDVDICYSDYFGAPYNGDLGTVHDCTGTNRIVNLYQQSNSHGAIDNSTGYNVPVCYGNLECQATTEATCVASEGIIIASLYQNTNSHIAEGNVAGYDIKICCAPFENVYWADTEGTKIGNDVGIGAQLGDTVQMVWEDADLPEGTEVTFEVYEDDLNFPPFSADDKIRTIDNNNEIIGKVESDGNAYGSWKITSDDLAETSDLDAFIFRTNGETSNELTINETVANARPLTQINNPITESNYTIRQGSVFSNDISFTQTSSDEDDDLKIKWDFGDNVNQEFLNCKALTDETLDCLNGNGDTTHTYNTSSLGTKIVKLTAKEMTRIQSEEDTSRIYIYGEDIIIFIIIDKEISGRVVEIDATRTHVSECKYDEAACNLAHGVNNGLGSSCYNVLDQDDQDDVEDVWCYDFELILDDNFRLIWEFDGVLGIPTQIGTEMRFVKVFDNPGEHIINIGAQFRLPTSP